MKEKQEQTGPCARAEDLVTYLYGELSEHEAALFRGHMEQCGSCKQELTAFSRVREDVIEWRNQSLPSFDFQHATAPARPSAEMPPQKRSALAALRQFFTLSPVWMRAATAAAALAICALVVFTAIHFSERPEAIVQVTPKAATQAQPDETTGRRTEANNQSETRVDKERQAAVVEQQRPVEVAREKNVAPRAKSRRATATPVTVAQQKQATPDKVKASQEARQQLAELVQTSRDDDDLPRLSDLIEDSSGSN